ncbi:kinase-like domain-containing protein, partial [Ochromonadaceae sp. CCMP2298]
LNPPAEVVTRWYRAPELLLGARFYSSAVDVWAAGCIFAEIVFRVPLFPGDSDLQQLAKIFNLLGTPNSGNWPTASLLPQYMEFEPRLALSLLPLFRRGGVGGVPAEQDLLLKMLALDPAKRITAAQALQHPYFTQVCVCV